MANQQNKAKILEIITKSNWGGAQRYVFDLATNLPSDRYSVKVALGGNGYLAEKLRANGVPVTEIPRLERDVNISSEISVLFWLIKYIKNEKPDVLHLNSSKIGAMGSLAGRIAGIKNIVFTVHGWAFNEDRSLISKTFIWLIYLITIILSHKVIAVSEKAGSQIPFKKLFAKKIHIIRNGVPSFDILPTDEARKFIKQIIGQNTEQKTGVSGTTLLCSIGELHPIKGHIYAIRAVKKLLDEQKEKENIEKTDRQTGGDIKYYIMGEGEYRKVLESEIAKLGLSENVFLLGNVKNASSYLSAFGILIMPSLSEGLPYVLLEAGFAGMPCIASNVGGIPEIITDGKDGILTEKADVESIKNAMRELINSPEKSRSYSDSLKTKIRDQFTIGNMVSETLKIF